MRQLRIILFVVLAFLTAVVQAQELLARDLQKDAAVSARDQRPLVLMFRSENCPYCRIVSRYLLPLADDPEWRDKILLRVVDIDSNQALVDVNGKQVTHSGFARAEGVAFVPVVRFAGPAGQRLAPDLVGLGLEDFYLSYLTAAIDKARDRLRVLRTTMNGASPIGPR